jgi:hypothetical protein
MVARNNHCGIFVEILGFQPGQKVGNLSAAAGKNVFVD